MDMKEATELLRTKMASVNDLDAVLKFDCGADGVVVIDGKVNPHVVGTENRDDVACTVTLSPENFVGIITGKLNPGIAFVMGRIKVKGDKSGLMKLQKIL